MNGSFHQLGSEPDSGTHALALSGPWVFFQRSSEGMRPGPAREPASLHLPDAGDGPDLVAGILPAVLQGSNEGELLLLEELVLLLHTSKGFLHLIHHPVCSFTGEEGSVQGRGESSSQGQTRGSSSGAVRCPWSLSAAHRAQQLPTTLGSRDCFHPHFAEKETRP